MATTQGAVNSLLMASPEYLDAAVSALQRALIVQTVTTKHTQLIRATMAGDIKSIEPLLHPNFMGVDSFGNMTTREQEMAQVASGKLKLISNEISDYHVFPFGPTMAMATGVARVKGTFEGKNISGTYNFHQVWANVSSAVGFTATAWTTTDMAIAASFNGAFTPEAV